MNVYDSEKEGVWVTIFPTIGAIPRDICEAPKDSVIGLDDSEGGSLVITLLVEYLGGETVDRCSHEELEFV